LRIGLLHPTTLLGQELRERLSDALGKGVEWALFGFGEEVGTVTEVGRAAALVEAATPELVAELDVLVACGADRAELVALRPPEATRPLLLQVAAEAVCSGGDPVVAGVNVSPAGSRSLIAANATTIVLAHALHALRDFEPAKLVSTVFLPVSVRGREALDEVLDQARSLLAFQPTPAADVLGAQLAFNLLSPAPGTRPAPDPGALAGELRAVTGTDLEASFAVLYAGVFHGLGILARLELGREASPDTVRERLLASPHLSAPDHASPGPIDTAARPDVLVGAVLPGGGAHAVWLYLLADNLALAAANAVAIVESLAPDSQERRAN
jgi:aspartate-semialdehyde dehydrogenase